MIFLSRSTLRRYLLTGALLALIIFPAALLAQTLADTSWTDYFGSSTGPHKDWGHASRVGSHRTSQIKSAIKRGDDIILGDSYGLDSARNEAKVAAFMDGIVADGGASFKQKIFNRSVELHEKKLNLGSADQVLLWLFGNEVTSVKYTINLRAWAGEPVQPAKPADPWVIPYYAEYYLALAVEAIEQAEVATGAEFPVVLGSIGNANTPSRRAFLYELLSYELQGTYASSLAGLTVAEIIDNIDIHYTIAKNTHVADENGKNIKHLKGSYELALSEIYDPWIDSGPVNALWSTEEVGRKVAVGGYGAAKTSVVTARYLHWWGKNDISAEQGRLLIFGTTLGPSATSVDLAMQTLYGFLGDTPLIEIVDAAVPPANDWETYVFESVSDNNKRVAFVIPSWTDIVSNSFTEFEIDATLWPGDVSAEVVVYGLGATKPSNATVDRQGDTLTVTVPSPITAQANRPPSIVIFLQRLVD